MNGSDSQAECKCAYLHAVLFPSKSPTNTDSSQTDQALDEVGVKTLAEALVFLRCDGDSLGRDGGASLELREELFADEDYLRQFGRQTQLKQ